MSDAHFRRAREVAGLFREDERADAAGAGRRIGDRRDDEHFAHTRVRDEAL